MNEREHLLHHLEQSDLVGVEELEPGDLITGAVVLVRVERVDEDGSALVLTSDVDFFTQLGMLTAARDLMRDEDD